MCCVKSGEEAEIVGNKKRKSFIKITLFICIIIPIIHFYILMYTMFKSKKLH